MSLPAAKACVPCREGISPLKDDEIVPLAKDVQGWPLVELNHLLKSYHFAFSILPSLCSMSVPPFRPTDPTRYKFMC
jgi:hypothetical protein